MRIKKLVSPSSLGRRLIRKLRFGRFDHAKVFEHIFETKYWGDSESVSGCGSSLKQTANIRRELPILFEKFEIGSIIDAPCGDLHWMARILEETNVRYFGGEIVPSLVELASQKISRENTEFEIFDITTNKFPEVDLWLCRDVLFHLSNDKIYAALDNFAKSNVKYILVTSHTDPSIINRNMVTGDFRQLNLLKAPFCLPEERLIYKFEDFAPPAPARDLLMFNREDIAEALKGLSTF